MLDEITTVFFYLILSCGSFARRMRGADPSTSRIAWEKIVTAWSEGKYSELYLGDNRDLLRTYARILDHIDIHEKLD